ncbi:hypothetical protein NDU88_003309 [Pleurodeles waltl]|uniref:Uncharacterized protein n=1 Tax=Pleurodeles waltl TaxID=8319 RepID=A0AAV7W1S0_PLEWA|nr:hypothetical protein NDU88_003309 [Pleurodeles waltl]
MRRSASSSRALLLPPRLSSPDGGLGGQGELRPRALLKRGAFQGPRSLSRPLGREYSGCLPGSWWAGQTAPTKDDM